MRIECRAVVEGFLSGDPEDFRGFSYEQICEELRGLVRAETRGEPNEEDIAHAARDIVHALADADAVARG